MFIARNIREILHKLQRSGMVCFRTAFRTVDDCLCIPYDLGMSTVELIYEKAKSLPGGLQSEALGFVEYLSRRSATKDEAAEWQGLFRDTQTLQAAQSVSDDDIAAEIAAYRSRQ